MIAGIFHRGSGLGDQLFRYITVRTVANEKDFEWGMIDSDNFKGKEIFPDIGLDYKNPLRSNGKTIDFQEKEVRDEDGIDIRGYDPEINFVKDHSIVEGSFEDSKYWGQNLGNINKWLAVEPLHVPDEVCVVGFRGGEYASSSDLFLTPSYFQEAIKEVLKKKNIREFQVHTDDPTLAESFFPSHYKVVENTSISHSKHSNMGYNWRSARYAKYAVIPNSAFFILPRILKHREDPTAVTIAPRFWARHNKKIWARPACYYREFTYICSTT